ncbi:response regulator [Paenibacillus athensensis]|uniref:Two-component system response regulator n=1 Tax=Paenibacillus athensensis TaxID=1967502 RepID=A0A4Y8PZ12_9BACL|nr:response regulator [Paenibacillus athensensis]MCD1261439.1 response regulator [Paenibacillus athensensis]
MTQRLKIMVCDDSALVRKKLKTVLEEQGYTDVREAENGEIAVEAVKADPPHVIFMDIVMPVKTGIEALKDIRAIAPDTKVIMASSVGTQSNLLEAIKLGAFDFVQKPFAAEEIVRVLAKVTKEGGHA